MIKFISLKTGRLYLARHIIWSVTDDYMRVCLCATRECISFYGNNDIVELDATLA